MRRASRRRVACYLASCLAALLVAQLSQHVTTLSIGPSTSESKKSAGQQQQNSIVGGGQPMTTLPPLLSTLGQVSHLDSLATNQISNQQQANVQQQTISNGQQKRSPNLESSARSNIESDHEDLAPLATISNHAKSQQAQISRPPQYVDVSGLVGRSNVSSTALNSAGLPAYQSPGVGGGGQSSLSGKSRSGLPECATQQVCNAIFVRMNYTQRLCECSGNYNWRCSNNPDPQDGHTIELTRKFDKRIKTCEPLREVRACKSPTDWTLLALQSERSGKAHYVVICKCPAWAQLEGPYTHNHPPYANIPGIRVYGMLCAHQTARSSAQTYSAFNPTLGAYPDFPWSDALSVLNTSRLLSTLDATI